MLDIRFTLPYTTLIPIAVVAAVFVVVRARRHGTSALVLTWQLMLLTYLAGLVGATFFPFQVHSGEYAGTAAWWNSINWLPVITIDARTFLLNVLLTAPLGVFIPVLSRWRTARAVVTAGVIVSVGIEVLQYVCVRLLSTGRTADINDVIANVLGVSLGYIILRLAIRRDTFARWMPGSDERNRTVLEGR